MSRATGSISTVRSARAPGPIRALRSAKSCIFARKCYTSCSRMPVRRLAFPTAIRPTVRLALGPSASPPGKRTLPRSGRKWQVAWTPTPPPCAPPTPAPSARPTTPTATRRATRSARGRKRRRRSTRRRTRLAPEGKTMATVVASAWVLPSSWAALRPSPPSATNRTKTKAAALPAPAQAWDGVLEAAASDMRTPLSVACLRWTKADSAWQVALA
mmetsp:Transcript_31058/g.89532  ORF Transcript_31058/g.89532 Transcript_31058/m.89532 type:complete len:215 (+) Transcript_31058:198-842(+)